MLKTRHRSGRETARRAEGLGRSADGGSVFSHAAGVRAKWDNENISGFARRPDGLPTPTATTDSDNRPFVLT